MKQAENRRKSYEWVVFGLSRFRFGCNTQLPEMENQQRPAKPMSIGSPQMPQQPSEVTAVAPSLPEVTRATGTPEPTRPMYHDHVPMARVSADAEALFPALAEFLKLARTHTLIPVCRRLVADLETPVSAFLRLAADEPESFLLESVEGGEKLGRYTFMGVRPATKLVARGDQVTTWQGKRQTTAQGDIFETLKAALASHRPAHVAGLPPFTAGAIGFFAYDVVRRIERLPSRAKDDLQLPDACLAFFHEVVAFDHVKKELLLIVNADVRAQAPKAAYAAAVRRLAALERQLAKPLPASRRRKHTASKLAVKKCTRKADYLRAVERTREYIAAGDIFQAVISQRFEVDPGDDPFAVYRALRIVNPSPYMYFLQLNVDADAGGRTKPKPIYIVGSSPELLVRVKQRQVEYRPIAGTRPRGQDEEEDERRAADLRADAKELSEHVMLVDLGRNDVGRVSDYGSVRVRDLMIVERYSHVMHLVSSIEGRLRPELSAVDAFRSCFPAGTLSGAPKVRAMEIIEELEPTRRGIYGGGVCYADYSGNLDSCIAIRSMLVKDGVGYIQAGAGIVADSVPEREYEECLNKAQAVLRAVERGRTS
jgi:anthranilate synthase component 1